MSLEQLIAQKRASALAEQEGDLQHTTHNQEHAEVADVSLPLQPVNDTSAISSLHAHDPDAILINIDLIDVTAQVRQAFDSQSLEELADDIAEHGQDSAILVRSSGEGRYELVAGERRLRAKQILCQREPENHVHQQIRATIKTLNDEQKENRQLAENIQREALKPLEIAQALASQKATYGYTDAQLAAMIKKDRSYVTRHLGLLNLSPELQYLIKTNEVKPNPALKHKEQLVEAAINTLPIGLREQIAQGAMSKLDALQARASWQETTDEQSPTSNQKSSEFGELSVSKPSSATKGPAKKQVKVSVSLGAAEALAELLSHISTELELNPVNVTKQKGRPVRKELLAALESRAQDVLQAYRKNKSPR